MSPSSTHRPAQKLVTGYRPVVHAREGQMLGIRQPLDGPVLGPFLPSLMNYGESSDQLLSW